MSSWPASSYSNGRGSCSSSRTRTGRQCFVDRKSTRLNSSHSQISYAVFCLKKKKQHKNHTYLAPLLLESVTLVRPCATHRRVPLDEAGSRPDTAPRSQHAPAL